MDIMEEYNDDFIKKTKSKLIEMGWEPICAKKFVIFLENTTENNTNCYPDKYPYWCEFIIAAHRLSQEQRPKEENILYILREIMGWDPDGEPIKRLTYEYLKGLELLDFYDRERHAL